MKGFDIMTGVRRDVVMQGIWKRRRKIEGKRKKKEYYSKNIRTAKVRKPQAELTPGISSGEAKGQKKDENIWWNQKKQHERWTFIAQHA